MKKIFALLIFVIFAPFSLANDERAPGLADITAFEKNVAQIWDGTIEAFAKQFGIKLKIVETANGRNGFGYVFGKEFWNVPASHVKVGERAGKVVELEFMFFNKGDSHKNSGGLETMHETNLEEKTGTLQKAKLNAQGWETCRKEIATELEKIGGKKRIRYGAGKIRKTVDSWQTPKTAFILDAPENEFVRLCIMPQTELRAATNYAVKRVKKATKQYAEFSKTDNGDVWIANVPMVDQGPKGYCVTATIERVLLYYKVENIDMHKLAELAGTSIGGGTAINKAVENLKPVLEKYHLDFETSKLSLKEIKSSIDNGVPLLWSLFSTQAYLLRAKESTEARAGVAKFSDWIKAQKKIKPLPAEKNAAHLCMIIGYNMKSKEVCVSNSWGDNFALCWVRFEDMLTVAMDKNLISIRP